jgi:hypothetical protein
MKSCLCGSPTQERDLHWPSLPGAVQIRACENREDREIGLGFRFYVAGPVDGLPPVFDRLPGVHRVQGLHDLHQPLFARLPATAVVFTWVYQHTKGSVFAAAILHGSLNLFSVAAPTPGDPLTPAMITLVVHWVVALVLVVFAGPERLDAFPSQAEVEPAAELAR